MGIVTMSHKREDIWVAEGCGPTVLVPKVGQARPRLGSSSSRQAFPRIPLLQLGQPACAYWKEHTAVKAGKKSASRFNSLGK